jgi:very-short-patch-repair endonuclease
VLWSAIRGGRLGTAFRRQVSDARRDRKLARLGYRVLRLEALAE